MYVAALSSFSEPVINIAIKPCMKRTEKVNAAERDIRTVPLIPQRPTFVTENPTSALPMYSFFVFEKFIFH